MNIKSGKAVIIDFQIEIAIQTMNARETKFNQKIINPYWDDCKAQNVVK